MDFTDRIYYGTAVGNEAKSDSSTVSHSIQLVCSFRFQCLAAHALYVVRLLHTNSRADKPTHWPGATCKTYNKHEKQMTYESDQSYCPHAAKVEYRMQSFRRTMARLRLNE